MPIIGCSLIVSLLVLSACKQPATTTPTTAPTQLANQTPSPPVTQTSPRPSGPIEFADVSGQSGIHFKHNSGAFGKKYLPANKLKLFSMVKTGSSYCSQSELPLVFGLGAPEEGKTLSLEIVWPSGQKDTLTDIKPNQSVTVQEGKGITSAAAIVFER